MKIIFDTTVFGHGFNAKASDFRLIKKFLESTPSELCVPAIVIEEAVNLVRKGIEEANQKLNVPQRLTGDTTTYAKLDLNSALVKYRSDLDTLLKSLKARILPYPSVSHEDLTNRALAVIKPFVSSGRGYRDALIWYSVLELASGCGEEIAFISANSDDWCRSKTEIELHSDLVKDLKAKGIDVASFRFFDSLASFVQMHAIEALPVSSTSAEAPLTPPDYQQLIIDGDKAIETLLASSLPDFLRSLSRADLAVEDLEVLGLSAATDISSSPIRTIDSERRLLQFSAKYRVAVQFLIKRADLAIWSQRLSLHQRQDWDESRLRIMATRAIKVLFHLVEKGENTESFSIASISPAYYSEYTGFDPVAVRHYQSEVHAPEHTNWANVKCVSCGEEFSVGCHRLYPQTSEAKYVAKLQQKLAADHKIGRPHDDLYEFSS
jgi:hypothetical protein